MKIVNVALRTVLFVAFAFMASSLKCDLFDKVDDVTFQAEFSHTFAISVDENDDLTYTSVGEIDPNSNAEFNKYRDQIKDLTIDEVTYTVQGYEGDAGITFNGTGEFSATTGSSTALGSASITNQNISSINNVETKLDYSTTDLGKIADELQNLQKVNFNLSGTFSGKPVAFGLVVKVKCTVKADAL